MLNKTIFERKVLYVNISHSFFRKYWRSDTTFITNSVYDGIRQITACVSNDGLLSVN